MAAGAYTACSGKNRRVVVATSGDTGSAAAHAFDNICVLYPQGKVSRVSGETDARQPEGGWRWQCRGDFDDCQRLAKSMLAAGEALSCNSVSSGTLAATGGDLRVGRKSGFPAEFSLSLRGINGNAVACIMAKENGGPPIQSRALGLQLRTVLPWLGTC